MTAFSAPYDVVVSGPEKYVYLVTNEQDVAILQTLNTLPCTLPEVGMRMKTGLTVDFRTRESLRDKYCEGAVPLLYSQQSPLVWVPAVVGIACLVFFVARQKRIEHPLISMRIFESSHFRISFIAQNCLFASFMGITLIVPLYVQGLCGGSAVEAGIVFIPATIMAVVVNPLAGILSDKVGARPVVIVAAALLTVGAVSMALMDENTPLWMTTLMQTVRGMGVSALIGPLNSWGMSGLPREIMMDASAFFAAVRQACASLGTAIMVLVITSLSATAQSGAMDMSFAYQAAFGISAVLAACVLVVVIAKVR